MECQDTIEIKEEPTVEEVFADLRAGRYTKGPLKDLTPEEIKKLCLSGKRGAQQFLCRRLGLSYMKMKDSLLLPHPSSETQSTCGEVIPSTTPIIQESESQHTELQPIHRSTNTIKLPQAK